MSYEKLGPQENTAERSEGNMRDMAKERGARRNKIMSLVGGAMVVGGVASMAMGAGQLAGVIKAAPGLEVGTTLANGTVVTEEMVKGVTGISGATNMVGGAVNTAVGSWIWGKSAPEHDKQVTHE